ncbi:SpaA isopeptide-forming pilin-related protein [Peptostreptococcus sp. D1]|uniref:SpaA isopeptide-forming pilin-related protein n=1 Tax=Peptostreptococcus sp. D1 TaxID=72304 RepID=UPI0008F423E8|nr:Cna B-type domain-containing protein [Peptostreptococcus sp. D1]SFE55681.1 Cna protein B-type domain-containing protein [Peptostreptococcus sp. D1]
MQNVRTKLILILLLTMLINVFSVYRIDSSSNALYNNQEYSSNNQAISKSISQEFTGELKNQILKSMLNTQNLNLPDFQAEASDELAKKGNGTIDALKEQPEVDSKGDTASKKESKTNDMSDEKRVSDMDITKAKDNSQPVFLSVTKIWKDDDDILSNEDTRYFSDLEIILHRKVNGEDDVEFNSKSKPVIIKYSEDEAKSWNYIFGGMDEFDAAGNMYEYYIQGDENFKLERKYSELELNPLDEYTLRGFTPRAARGNLSKLKYVTPDTVYEKTHYYTQNPLGIIGGFHLVGFNSVETKAHTNGNILTDTLKYISNFGTSNLPEVSYFRHLNINSDGFKSTSVPHGSRLVVGDGVNVGVKTNPNNPSVIEAWTFENKNVDSPGYYSGNELWKDSNTKFIDLLKVKSDSENINRQLSGYKDIYSVPDYHDWNQQKITIQNPDDVSVYNWKHGEFKTDGYNVNIHGFERGKNGSLIINVDMKGLQSFVMPGSTYYYSDGSQANIAEVTEWEDGNTIWNFYDSSKPDRIFRGKINNSRAAIGIIMAPGATVDLTANFNGTVVANDIIVTAESHRTDFTGKSIDYPADFHFTKADEKKHGLPNAVFELRDEYDRVINLKDSDGNIIGNEVRSDSMGKLSFYKLTTGVYYLYEKRAPDGYQRIDGRIIKLRVDTNRKIKEITVLNNLFNKNDNTITNIEIPVIPKTKVEIHKRWVDSDGNPIDKEKLKNLSIKVRLKRKIGNIVDYGFNKYESIHLKYDNNWKIEISELEIYNESGSAYTYYIEEYDIPLGFTEDSSNSNKEWVANEYEDAFAFTLVNKARKPVYPNTGGIGAMSVIAIGMLIALMGMYIKLRTYY